MATDISNSYDKANENLAKLRTFSESKNAINEALKKGENISTPSFDFSTFQENQSELESKIKKKVQNQLDQLLNLVLANKGSGNSTTDYLKSTFLTTAKSLRTKILEILVEEIIKALGCDLEQTYDAQKIYIKVSSIDLFKLLQTNPATTAGKFLYEPSAFDPNSSPRSTNKMLYNLTQNPNIFYSNPSLYGQNYLDDYVSVQDRLKEFINAFPDYRQPRSVTISWLVDSLLFYGVGYLRVTELYADDLRPSRFEWVANNRVTFTTNKFGTEVEEYFVDGVRAPMSGIGSLITFQGLTQGVLTTAARTIHVIFTCPEVHSR